MKQKLHVNDTGRAIYTHPSWLTMDHGPHKVDHRRDWICCWPYHTQAHYECVCVCPALENCVEMLSSSLPCAAKVNLGSLFQQVNYAWFSFLKWSWKSCIREPTKLFIISMLAASPTITIKCLYCVVNVFRSSHNPQTIRYKYAILAGRIWTQIVGVFVRCRM